MKGQIKLTRTNSRLAQAGTVAKPFHLDSLSVREIEVFTAVKLRAIDGVEHDLPEKTGASIGDDPATMCLRPGEWLRLSESGANAGFLMDENGAGLYQWNVSDALGILRVEGEAAPWLMRKNSGLDFDVSGDTPDHCARCKFGRTSVLVHYRQARIGQFSLIVDRGLLTYLWTLLISTAPHAVEMYAAFGASRGRGRS